MLAEPPPPRPRSSPVRVVNAPPLSARLSKPGTAIGKPTALKAAGVADDAAGPAALAAAASLPSSSVQRKRPSVTWLGSGLGG